MRIKGSNPWFLFIPLVIVTTLMAVYPATFPDNPEAVRQIIEDIAPQDAYTLMQENRANDSFTILDVRTPEEFAQGHIRNAVNLDHYAEGFPVSLSELDRDMTYLVYCRSGVRSQSTLEMMADLGFHEVYNMLGGITRWQAEGLPVVNKTMANITPREAFNLIEENRNNPDFTIIDLRTPFEFSYGHLEGAINLDFHSPALTTEIDRLQRAKTYLIYYACDCGGVDQQVLRYMATIGFYAVYNITGGFEDWVEENLPIAP